MTTRKKITIAIATVLAIGALSLFAQSRATRFYAVLIKSINALDTAFEIDLATGQTTNPITVKNSAGTTIYGITRLGAVSFSGALASGGAVSGTSLSTTGAVAASGSITPAGGVVATSATAPCHLYAGFEPPATTTTGTDTAGINGTFWISEVIVPSNCTATGISYLLGSVGGTDKVVVALFSSAGAVLANSAVDSSVTAGTTATFQRVPFTATYAVTGPGKYFIGVQFNGSTAKIRTHAFGDHDTTSISQTFNTIVAITPPTTFTASKGPVSMLY